MKISKIAATSAFVFAVAASGVAHAALVFSFDSSDSGLTTISKTVGGVTLLVSDFDSSNNLSKSDSDGLCTAGSGGDYCDGIAAYQLLFDAPITLISYFTGYNDFAAGALASVTFSQGSNSSLQLGSEFRQGETTLFNNQFTVAANTPIFVSRTLGTPTTSSMQIREITVEEASVPSPGTISLLAIGVALVVRRSRRNPEHNKKLRG